MPRSVRALSAVAFVSIGSLIGVAAALGSGRGSGLSRTEREAIHIRALVVNTTGRSVRADVYLRGDLQRRIGQRQLRNAAIGLVLRSHSHGRRAIVIALLGRLARSRLVAGDTGGGRLPHDLRYVVVRDHDHIAFTVVGLPAGATESVEVDTVLWPASAGTPGRPAVLGGFATREHAVDHRAVSSTSSPPTCTALESELANAPQDVSKLQAAAGKIQTELGNIRDALANGLITPAEFNELSTELNQDLTNVNASESELQTIIIPALEREIEQDSCPGG
jgi:hypothetical protein